MLYIFASKNARTNQLARADQENGDSPQTPALNNTCHKDLFGIVGNIWTKSIYDMSVVSVRALSNFGRLHMRFHLIKYSGDGRVKELALEVSELIIVGMFLVS